ncbi:MAG: hypothetical protein ABSB35_11785 [Bryobacteraceae bacterium]|jgi:hypothetical protein
MDIHTYIPGEVNHRSAFRILRYGAVGLTLLCVALIAYSMIDVFNDFRLVNKAFPSLSSDFTTDLDASIAFSPVMLQLDRFENGFLRWIKYPTLTTPSTPSPTGNPIGDEIHKAQKDQDLLVLDGVLPLEEITQLKQPSIKSVGRAIYLGQESPAATRAFERGNAESSADPAFAGDTAVKQLQQIFEVAYGRRALQQAMRSQK